MESDPFFVNYSPYEYQLAENRPFFNEGSQIFSLPFNLFYSRRIENPKAMSKLTGREGPWNIGIISAWDKPVGKPEQLVHVERIQKDIFATSKIGVMASSIETGEGYGRNISIDGLFNQGCEHHLQFQYAASFNSDQAEKDCSVFYLRHWVNKFAGVNYGFNYTDVGPNYDPRTGLISQTGYRNPALSLGYQWHLAEWGIESVGLYSNANLSRSYSGLQLGESAGLSMSVVFINKLSGQISLSAGQNRSQVLTDEELSWNPRMFRGNSLSLSIASQTGALFDGNVAYSLGTGGVYVDDFTRQTEGQNQSLSFGVAVRPKPNILFRNSSSWSKQEAYFDNEVLYDVWLISNSLHYQISRKLFSRAVQQMDVSVKRQQIDFLVGYEFHAGSTFYLSYKEMREGDWDVYDRRNYMIFGKMSYLFRI